jgi:shikimate kinase
MSYQIPLDRLKRYFWLTSSSVEQLVKRTAKSKARPLLEQSNDREKTLRDLLQAREGFYQQVAGFCTNPEAFVFHADETRFHLLCQKYNRLRRQYAPRFT